MDSELLQPFHMQQAQVSQQNFEGFDKGLLESQIPQEEKKEVIQINIDSHISQVSVRKEPNEEFFMMLLLSYKLNH